MNFSYGFIKRPIATTLLMMMIALFGVIAYQALPVADLPNVDFPTITVSAGLPGADPATMASAVATPLERQFTTIAGIDNMTSTSNMGSTSITLQFNLDRDIDGAAVDVQTAIAAAMPLLPPGMPSPPSFRKVNPSDSPVMFLSLVAPAMSMSQMDDLAQNVIAQRISTVPGVAQVDSFGSQKFAVRVKVDPDALAARKIGINEVATAVRQWNVNLPVGTLWGRRQTFNLQANGQLMNASEYAEMVLAWRNGAPVRLKDVARVVDSVEEERSAGYLYSPGREDKSINLMVQRQPNSNVIQVNDRIREMIPVIQKQLPPALTLGIRGDRSLVIRESFHEIQFTMAVTIGLVVLVIFVFLRNASATLIPTLALPFSILGTFGVMYLCGYSLNNLSMMALILSVGFVVDDAIVMLENIVRHIE
ncbi:MAG: efflux RND transporter permease subunit, partial [Bryobacterales bacterium]|nr:efflux RND transporter permease subunit [Bryobacterales bacterium]